MQAPSQLTTRLSGSLVLLRALLLLAVSAAFAFSGPALAEANTSGMTLKDENPVRPSQIRQNYFKRFPYAKAYGEADHPENGESPAGSEKSFQAYKQVRKKCTDGLGTMDGKPCDTDGAPLYCAEECIPDECPPYGKHCPVTPHYNWAQDQETATVTPPTARDGDSLDTGKVDTQGLPMSDAMYQVIDRNNKQRLLEMMFDPERTMWTQTATGQLQMSSMANSMGGAAEASFDSAFSAIRSQLINVANERATAGGSQGGTGNSIEQAVYIVQRVYKEVFLPMAVLFLLPGAVLTQVKGLVGRSITGGDEDSMNPFTGMIRAIIAVFLIPCTQLIVSYCIDIGNSLAYEVARPDRGWVQDQALTNWAKEQTFNTKPVNVNNGILPPGQGRTTRGDGQQGQDAVMPAGASNGSNYGSSYQAQQGGDYRSQRLSNESASGSSGATGPIDVGPIFGVSASANSTVQAFNSFLNFFFGTPFQDAVDDAQQGGEGKASGQLESRVIQEDQKYLSTVMQLGFNGASLAMGSALNILVAYQLVFMCYLFLMGPISACFFAWPSGIGNLFKKVFSNWLDAVVVLSLWRFWWCAILAIMTQRIVYLHPNAGSPSEMMVYTCFLALLLYIPFQPFDFRPGPMVSQVLEKAGVGGGAGGGGGKGGNAQGASADVTGADTRASHSSTTRRDASAGRDLPTISSGSRGAGPGSHSLRTAPAMAPGSIPVAGQPPSSSKAQGPATNMPLPPPARPAVSGGSVAASPPPSQSFGRVQSTNPAVNAAQAQMGNQANVAAVPPATPPVVPLSPSVGMPTMLVNTASPGMAVQGAKAWQQAGSPLSSGQGGSAAVPAAGALAISPATMPSAPASAGRANVASPLSPGGVSASPAAGAAPAPAAAPLVSPGPGASVGSAPAAAQNQLPASSPLSDRNAQPATSAVAVAVASAPPISSAPAGDANLGVSPPPAQNPGNQ